MTEPPTRHVALIVETSNAYARGLLAGIHEFVVTQPRWSIYLGEHSRQDSDLSWLEGWRGDGVIARIENQRTARQVRRLGLPVVDVSAAGLAEEFPVVETDDDAIVRLALQHFADRGLRNLAFCGDSRFGWSNKRHESFMTHTRERGVEPHEFVLRETAPAAVNRRALVSWLRGLPKPVGILACYDIAGQEILEACKIAAIQVPEEVAVLGVDNDELFCNLTSPPMSSIQPDTARTGWLAASLLDEMMQQRAVEPGLHLVEPLRVVTRRSTDVLTIDDPAVAKALRFIRDNAHRAVRVDEVARHVGLARRSLDLRFTTAIGRTTHDEIDRERMNEVADLLLHTDWTLPRIAEHLAFSHAEYMSVAFRRRFGKPPGEYRRTARR